MKFLSAKLGAHVWAGHQAAAEDQDIQEADRGGGGDCRPQSRQVSQGKVFLRTPPYSNNYKALIKLAVWKST